MTLPHGEAYTQLEAGAAAAAEAAATVKTKLQKELSSEKRRGEAAQAVAEKATAEISVIARKQDTLQRVGAD
jgi:hypothetical protein